MFIFLPGKPRSFTYKIPLNEGGVPILPQVADDASASQVAVLLGDYLELLWGAYPIESSMSFKLTFSPENCWSGGPKAPPFPWDDITINPDRYFDTFQFDLPHALNPPRLLKKSATFQLYKYFSSLPMSEPFHFYSQKPRPTAGSHFPAPTPNTPLDDSPTNPQTLSSISPSLDAAKDYTDITQRPMPPFSSNPTLVTSPVIADHVGLDKTPPNIPPAAVAGVVTSLSTAASTLGVEEASLPVPASMGPATKKRGQPKAAPKQKGNGRAAQKKPLVGTDAPTHLEFNSSSVGILTRRSARAVPLKRKEPDTHNSNDEARPAQKKRKPHWVWVDGNGEVVEQNPQ